MTFSSTWAFVGPFQETTIAFIFNHFLVAFTEFMVVDVYFKD